VPWRRIGGPVLTVVLSGLALPINLLAIFWFGVSIHDYDSSGQGGPFRSCTADSTVCSGMNPVGILISVAVFVTVAVLIGFAGQAVALFRSKTAGRLGMIALGVVVTTVGAGVVWAVMTQPRA
jgi:hypothetical protein